MPNFTGNTTLSNVEANQSIIVTDGSLTIQGDVGSGARITLKNSRSGDSNQIRFGNSKVVNGNNGHKFIVEGNVLDRANITGNFGMEFRGYLSDHIKVKNKQGNIIVKGNVGSNTTLKSMSGNVSVGDVGTNTTLESMSGNVSVGDVGTNTTLESMSGNVSAGNVGSNTVLKSMSGNVSILSYDTSATIETMSGKCYVNGKRNDRRQNRNNSSFNNIHIGSNYSYTNAPFSFDMSNLSNFFSSETTTHILNGRVFINGVEQTVPISTTRGQELPTTNRTKNPNENDMPAALQSYIDGFEGESFQDAFKRLAVNVSDKYPFLKIVCIISQDIPNIPVSLNGRLYDWWSLKSQIETNGYEDPMTREIFTLKQVIPDRTTRDNLEGILKNEEEIHKSDMAMATCSSPVFER